MKYLEPIVIFPVAAVEIEREKLFIMALKGSTELTISDSGGNNSVLTDTGESMTGGDTTTDTIVGVSRSTTNDKKHTKSCSPCSSSLTKQFGLMLWKNFILQVRDYCYVQLHNNITARKTWRCENIYLICIGLYIVMS